MIGDFRTDALHQALREAPIDDHRLLALLVLALSGLNVAVQNPDLDRWDRRAISRTVIENGRLSTDPDGSARPHATC